MLKKWQQLQILGLVQLEFYKMYRCSGVICAEAVGMSCN
jgi:hypothetical protein